jgi:acetyl esterase/lipase
MAAQGWVCVSVDYRLSPHATFPEHLVDCKQALRWIRENGPEFGADPEFVVVTGGSAGGHLCSLVALTANDPEYQPGFEQLDTSVQGCVPFYGVYDFTDRAGDHPHRGLCDLLESSVMKASLEEAPEEYEKASPLARVTSEAPPFFVIHGDTDTLAPVRSARRFVSALREKSANAVLYAEIPGAQHAFELFHSLRSYYAVHAVERFCASLHSDYLRRGT